ncbi:MAG TPA: site-specific DNA-methyltransferase [Firmicutes bacterium]|nr:site-specific DNA-methyltransferase [Bacillota bacterium]
MKRISTLDSRLLQAFGERLYVDHTLTRQLVSFQANKSRASYRWYKYKEAFSAALVEHLFRRCAVSSGRILDPFAGSGTALFAASSLGLDADGIELLPIGQEIIFTRLCLERELTKHDFDTIQRWARTHPWRHSGIKVPIPTLRITKGAYPPETTDDIERYLGAVTKESVRVQGVLRFALLCVLEEISYTRKDGQYLRWDVRSGRRPGASKPFNKGPIRSFDEAIVGKLQEICDDLRGQLQFETRQGQIRLHKGSVFNILPALPGDLYDGLITSPPYCNRYDYTRTYALELALLGIGEKELIKLRQEMLSSTVENRAKDLLAFNPKWSEAIQVADRQTLLQAILTYLENLRVNRKLNNTSIPRMVRSYFYEMACVIYECARVLKPNAPFIMVNDNVRYAGVSVSVDLILSHMAEALGFRVENILVLPNGKGNSSQQMGKHGRDILRKGVYVWRKV